MVLGPRESFFTTNNEVALVLNMALPLLLYLAREERRRWLRRVLWSVLGLLLLVLLLVGVKAGQIVTMVRAGESFAPPPESVSAAKVEQVEWQASRVAVGSLVAARGVTLSAELPGMVREIAFESGSAVRKGQLLVRLDTSTEEAQLAASRAEAALAKLSLERARTLEAAQSAEVEGR